MSCVGHGMLAAGRLARAVRGVGRGPRVALSSAPACGAMPPGSSPAVPSSKLPSVNLYGYTLPQVSDLLRSLGKPAYRARQVWECMYPTTTAAPTAAATLHGLTTWSKSDRAELGDALTWCPGSIAQAQTSADGTRKWLVVTPTHPSATVECVYIPDVHAVTGRTRGTLCVSSQAGCSLSCTFCHTGTQKLQRNLSAADIVGQVVLANRALMAQAAATRPATAADGTSRPGTLPLRRLLHNVVFMGQGEPGYNWRQVRHAIHILTSPTGMAFPSHRITVSTSGVAPIIPRIAADTPGVRLAVSLHAPTDALRSRIMAINDTYPIAAVLEACRQYIQTRVAADRPAPDAGGGEDASIRAGAHHHDSDDDAVGEGRACVADRHNSRRRVRITFEYVMLKGVNDSEGHAVQLRDLLRCELPAHTAHVNLIPFNPWPGSPYEGSSSATILAFQNVVTGRERGASSGIGCHIRRTMGSDILGACGQLRTDVPAATQTRPAPTAPMSGFD